MTMPADQHLGHGDSGQAQRKSSSIVLERPSCPWRRVDREFALKRDRAPVRQERSPPPVQSWSGCCMNGSMSLGNKDRRRSGRQLDDGRPRQMVRCNSAHQSSPSPRSPLLASTLLRVTLYQSPVDTDCPLHSGTKIRRARRTHLLCFSRRYSSRTAILCGKDRFCH